MATVMTVRDFTQIFDAYAQFEESLVTRRMVRGPVSRACLGRARTRCSGVCGVVC